MFAGVRPYVTAGVALVGASVITVTPIGAPPASIPEMSPTVQLASIPSPLQLYPQVFGTALQNAGALLGEYFADPFPIIGATLENQAGAVRDALTALESGRFGEFVTAVANVLVQPFTSAGAALSHLNALLRQPFAVQGFFLIAISPVLSGIAATGQAIGDVFEAITTFDVVGCVNAVVNIPARIVDGVLNGVPGTSFGILQDLPGLLSPSDPESFLPPGPISVGIGLDQDMGAAIPPRTPIFPVTETPDPDAASVTLFTESVPETVPVQDVFTNQDEAAPDVATLEPAGTGEDDGTAENGQELAAADEPAAGEEDVDAAEPGEPTRENTATDPGGDDEQSKTPERSDADHSDDAGGSGDDPE